MDINAIKEYINISEHIGIINQFNQYRDYQKNFYNIWDFRLKVSILVLVLIYIIYNIYYNDNKNTEMFIDQPREKIIEKYIPTSNQSYIQCPPHYSQLTYEPN